VCACVCLCVFLCVCVCVHVGLCTHAWGRKCMCVRVYLRLCLLVCACVCVHAHVSIRLCSFLISPSELVRRVYHRYSDVWGSNRLILTGWVAQLWRGTEVVWQSPFHAVLENIIKIWNKIWKSIFFGWKEPECTFGGEKNRCGRMSQKC